MENKMFCYQCQETANNSGCKLAGVCGKKPELSNALDLLVYIVKGIGVTYNLCKEKGLLCPDVEKVYNFVNDALFCSITNANFDIESVYRRIDEGILLRNSLIRSIKDKGLGVPDMDVLAWNGNRDEYDENEEDVIQKISDVEYIASGTAKLDEINETIGLDLESDDYDSIAGHIISLLDHLPKEGETVVDHYVEYKVVSVEKNRIEKVHILLLPVPENEEDSTEEMESA